LQTQLTFKSAEGEHALRRSGISLLLVQLGPMQVASKLMQCSFRLRDLYYYARYKSICKGKETNLLQQAAAYQIPCNVLCLPVLAHALRRDDHVGTRDASAVYFGVEEQDQLLVAGIVRLL